MNFSLLFALVSNLTFSLHYEINSNQTQDYFIFQSSNNTAHLSRRNNTLQLYLRQDGAYEIYNYSVTKNFEFSWDGYKVNNDKMLLIRTTGQVQVDAVSFDSYAFLSPILRFYGLTLSDADVDEPEPVFGCKEVNYGYIAFILIGVFLGFELKQLPPVIYRELVDRFNFNPLDQEPETSI